MTDSMGRRGFDDAPTGRIAVAWKPPPLVWESGRHSERELDDSGWSARFRDEPFDDEAFDDEPSDGVVDPDDEDPDDGSTTRPSRRRLRRVLISLGVLVLVLLGFVGGGLWYLTERYAGNIDRVDGVFAGLDESTRPAPATSGSGDAPVTFLLVGSDTRAELEPGELPDARSDAIMLARFAGDGESAQIISIPRDSWVDIPGHGLGKVNAAYAYGGPTLLIQTIEAVTGVRIDHYAAIDFAGLIQVTDDLGGVDVVLPEATANGPYEFPAGLNHLDGDQARYYVGQRHGLPGGDFDRVRRQQNYLRAMFTKLFAQASPTDPGQLDSVMRAVTSSIAIDDGLSNADLLSMALSLRDLRPADVSFFTAPVLGTGREGSASVVYLDDVTGERMWGYLRTDSLAANTGEFATDALPAIPR